MLPSVLDDVVPPLAFQFHATKVLVLTFKLSSVPKVKPSLSNDVKELAVVASALVAADIIFFNTPLELSNSL
jgi:hypothetical protein